jgi:hypothetical protein
MSSEELNELHDEEFLKAQQDVARRIAGERHKDHQQLAQQVLNVAGETITLANAIASDGDPDKQELARLIKASALDAAREVTTGRHQAVESREAREASPFVATSVTSKTSGSLPNPSLKALPHEASLPVKKKRGRGRPKKDAQD